MRVTRPKFSDLHRFLLVLSVCACVVVTVSFPTFSYADDLNVEYRIGSSEKDFVPFAQGTNLGFQGAPVWFKVSIPNQGIATSQVLLIRPVHLDEVQVFLGSPDGDNIGQFGDTLTSAQGVISDGYSLAIQADWRGADLYLRIQTKNVLHPSFRMDSLEAVIQHSKITLLILGVIFAITLCYLTWAVSVAMNSPNLIIFAFSVRLILFLGTLSIHSGLLRDLISDGHLPPQDIAHNLTALAYVTAAQLFDFLLLRTVSSHWSVKLFAVLLGVFTIVKFSFYTLGQVSAALAVNNLSALVILLVGAFAAGAVFWQRKRNKLSQAWLILTYFILQFIPLFALVILNQMDSNKYQAVFDLMFLSYAIVPSGCVVVILYLWQRSFKRDAYRLKSSVERLELISKSEANKRQEIAQLLDMLNHEIKTPLSTLRMAEAAGRLDEKVLHNTVEAITKILAQSSRAETLATGDLVLQLTEVPLKKLVASTLQNMECHVLIDGGDSTLLADSGFLQIVISNLISNAVKYSSDANGIVAKIHEHNGITELVVTNPIARAVSKPESIFTKYFRSPEAQKMSGSGLGLYVSKELCRKMNIELDVISSESEFSIRLKGPAYA